MPVLLQLYAFTCPLRPPSRARSCAGPGWRPNSRPPKDHVFSSASYMPSPEPDKQVGSAVWAVQWGGTCADGPMLRVQPQGAGAGSVT